MLAFPRYAALGGDGRRVPGGTRVRAALDDEDAARATILSLFEPGYVVTED
jgi:hypothetical protein